MARIKYDWNMAAAWCLQVVFLHKPSRFIIVSDLYWNYDDRASNLAFGTQAWKFGMDRIYKPFYRRFMIREKGGERCQSDVLPEAPQRSLASYCH